MIEFKKCIQKNSNLYKVHSFNHHANNQQAICRLNYCPGLLVCSRVATGPRFNALHSPWGIRHVSRAYLIAPVSNDLPVFCNFPNRLGEICTEGLGIFGFKTLISLYNQMIFGILYKTHEASKIKRTNPNEVQIEMNDEQNLLVIVMKRAGIFVVAFGLLGVSFYFNLTREIDTIVEHLNCTEVVAWSAWNRIHRMFFCLIIDFNK